jgi:ankyrin repeat protein
VLLEKGAEIEAKDKNGQTQLYWASRNGHLEIVQPLLDWGAA